MLGRGETSITSTMMISCARSLLNYGMGPTPDNIFAAPNVGRS